MTTPALTEREFQRRLRRFMSKVAFLDSCWMWTGARDRRGYGTFVVSTGLRRSAYRWLYETLIGDVPEGKELDHLCRQPSCVRPDHLEPVTHLENVRRGNAGGHAQRARTHCPKGHPYSGDNLHIRPDGGRACNECSRIHSREYQRKRRAALRAAA